jgi:anti-sigma factor RsiW
MQEKLEAYLDDGLSPAERQEVEALVASDPRAAKMLAAAKAQRSLRAAAYASYLPTRAEASAMAAQFMDRAYAPVGRVGIWLRRSLTAAAAIAILVGTFAIGRTTAPTKTQYVDHDVNHYYYNVVYTDSNGIQWMRDFASADERDKFVKELETGGATGIAVADLTLPGHL